MLKPDLNPACFIEISEKTWSKICLSRKLAKLNETKVKENWKLIYIIYILTYKMHIISVRGRKRMKQKASESLRRGLRCSTNLATNEASGIFGLNRSWSI